MSDDFTKLRNRMVDEQIARRGVKDPKTLIAMRTVPRHLFVPSKLWPVAYVDSPLPIAEGQTISQPYIVALMTQTADVGPDSVVLDIGTGSGYAAAIFAHIVKQVYSIERIASLADEAKNKLEEMGYQNIEVKTGDGSQGWPEKAPFDAIVVTAGAPVVPESLKKQLKVGGCLVIPVGDAFSQQLLRIRKIGDSKFTEEIIEFVRFVPLIGKEGWGEKTHYL